MSKARYYTSVLLNYYYFIVLLLPLGYILHVNNEYQDIIPVEIYLKYLLRYALLAFIVSVAALYIFRRKPLNGAIVSTIFLLLFFFFGSMHDWWRRTAPGTLSSYKIVLPLFIILFAFLVYHLKRSHEKNRFYKYLKYLVLISLLFEVGMNLVQLVSKKRAANDLSGAPISIQKGCGQELPDIFYVVWDEYPSSASLKEDLGFDNSLTDSLFRVNGFYVVDSSLSNYNVTPFSLSATLDASYLKAGIEKHYDARLFLQGLKTYEQSAVVHHFQSLGYEVKNYGRFPLEDTQWEGDHYFTRMFEQAVNGSTLFAKIEKDLWWHVSLRNIFTGEDRVPAKYRARRDEHLKANRVTYENLMRELTANSNKPRFVLAHLMLPHDPYYLKSDGSLQPDSLLLEKALPAKEGFLEQLVYTNTLLHRSIAASGKNLNRKRVVIMQGDHGFRYYDSEADSNKHFRNLNGIYFSDRDYSALNKKLSSVNTFRVILNKYFCQDLPMLKDSTIYVKIPKE